MPHILFFYREVIYKKNLLIMFI